MKKALLPALVLLALTASPAFAAEHKHNQHAHMHDSSSHKAKMKKEDCHCMPGMVNMAKTAKTAGDKALLAVSHKMHNDMDVALIGTPDGDFTRAMIPHHQGAIDMARVVLKYGKDDDVKWLAGNIIKAQTWEISWMKRWLNRTNQNKAVEVGKGAMMRSADTMAERELMGIHHDMHKAMDIKLTGDPDGDFIRAMIPHHQGAIDMAYWVLTNGRNTETQELARDIIKAQTAEISWMRGWLKDRGLAQN